MSQGLGQMIDLQDSAPLIGGQSLFDVPPAHWVGKPLEMGTATTSPIQSVETEQDPNVVQAMTQAAARSVVPVPQSEAASSTLSPYSTLKGSHRLFVGKDTHKFSAAHMTVFPDGTKERIHGHNFQVMVALDLINTQPERLIDLGRIKAALMDQCLAWDQRLLLAQHNRHFRLLRRDAHECEFSLCGRHYVVPADEVILLPLDNVVVESLAELFARALLERLRAFVPAGEVSRMEVTVTESQGQGAAFSLVLPPASRSD
jgi:6-pyruvoyltetrahydropterin/6-carboxytetrahydropterin synthase